MSAQSLVAEIATVTDVVNEGYRNLPGDDERRTALSGEFVPDEALRTESESGIAVKFIDDSELGVEAESEVVLSDCLFDPGAAATSSVINPNTGLFHFNSNDIPDSGLVLKTPVATIGIRGTEFLMTVKDEITILDGLVEVAPLDGSKPITCQGGQSILVASPQSDAVCGDFGEFSTAAGEPPPSKRKPATVTTTTSSQRAAGRARRRAAEARLAAAMAGPPIQAVGIARSRGPANPAVANVASVTSLRAG